MDLTRYIIVQAIQTEDNTLIPIWDTSLTYSNTEMYGATITVLGKHKKYYNTVDCIFDLKTKKLCLGLELDVYPNIDELEFKCEESIYYEINNREYRKTLGEATIKSIEFHKFNLELIKGDALDKEYLKLLNLSELNPKAICVIKHWQPVYILDNEIEIHYDHKLYHKLK